MCSYVKVFIGTTKKIVDAIASGIKPYNIVRIDITTKNDIQFQTEEGDLLIVGAPVYAGRIPDLAMKRLKNIKGNGQPVVCVSVYGNRGFGESLAELCDQMQKKKFSIIGAGGFIGEHSFSNNKAKIAEGRPNQEDLLTAVEFGKKINDKYKRLGDRSFDTTILGEVPTKKALEMQKMGSEINNNCINCKKCIEICPAGAISEDLLCDTEKCIKCFACVKNCSHKARELKSSFLTEFALSLSVLEPKKPEMFL